MSGDDHSSSHTRHKHKKTKHKKHKHDSHKHSHSPDRNQDGVRHRKDTNNEHKDRHSLDKRRDRDEDHKHHKRKHSYDKIYDSKYGDRDSLDHRKLGGSSKCAKSEGEDLVSSDYEGRDHHGSRKKRKGYHREDDEIDNPPKGKDHFENERAVAKQETLSAEPEMYSNSGTNAEESSSSESDAESNEVDWHAYRSTLDKIFFKEDDLIKRRSDAYNDFWKFHDKFVAFERRKAMQKSGEKFLQNQAFGN